MAERAIHYPPGPSTPAFVQTATYARDPVTAIEKWHDAYGDTFTIQLLGFGRFVFASAPRELRQIFTADPETVQTGAANGQILPIVGAQSVLTLDGQAHHRHRRMMLPPFHGDRMATYAEVIRDVTRRSMQTWSAREPFALHPYMLQITLEVILRNVFGIDERQKLASFGTMFSELIERWSSPLLPMLAFYGIDPVRMMPWLPVARRKAALDEALRAEITERRAAGDTGRTDIFSLLLSARDEQGEPLSEEELRDELVTLMIAGHETSATTLAWAFERVLCHPDVLAKLRDELRGITRADGELDLARIDQLVYLDAVVRETLRQRPILAFLARRTTVEIDIGDYRVPPGTFLCPAIHLAHRRAETYPDPETFLPDRFIGKKVDPYAWLPFGGGGRRCLGMAFALFEMKLILATVLSTAELHLDPGGPLPRVLRGVTVAPSGGTRVIRSR
jgi:cytochrome P450